MLDLAHTKPNQNHQLAANFMDYLNMSDDSKFEFEKF